MINEACVACYHMALVFAITHLYNNNKIIKVKLTRLCQFLMKIIPVIN